MVVALPTDVKIAAAVACVIALLDVADIPFAAVAVNVVA